MHINHQYQSRICHEENENSQNRLVFNTIQSIVSFFPQMKPEVKPLAISDEAKFIVELLKAENNQELGSLKTKSELSGKKWDAAMKELAKHNLTKVIVEGENKTVILL